MSNLFYSAGLTATRVVADLAKEPANVAVAVGIRFLNAHAKDGSPRAAALAALSLAEHIADTQSTHGFGSTKLGDSLDFVRRHTGGLGAMMPTLDRDHLAETQKNVLTTLHESNARFFASNPDGALATVYNAYEKNVRQKNSEDITAAMGGWSSQEALKAYKIENFGCRKNLVTDLANDLADFARQGQNKKPLYDTVTNAIINLAGFLEDKGAVENLKDAWSFIAEKEWNEGDQQSRANMTKSLREIANFTKSEFHFDRDVPFRPLLQEQATAFLDKHNIPAQESPAQKTENAPARPKLALRTRTA